MSSLLSSGLAHTALLVIDVQQAFIYEAALAKEELSTPNMESNITALLAAFRAKGLPVIHVHHVNTTETGGLWNEESHPEGVRPQDYVAPQPGESVLRKYNKSSGFTALLVTDGRTSLKEVLDAKGINTIVIVGLSSAHCVSSTARSGHDAGFSVVVVGDASGTYGETPVPKHSSIKGDADGGKAWSAQTAHALALGHLSTGELAQVVSTETVLTFV
ncbi:Isochorismatase-like protein [Roridomyces roridus]|uniref:Isochorismatase-like protein n=1 Tax=Roridomyces roridus TaxID=1738132 RepID=A0AAD7FHS1_9AGAR|nr:Isochorismatase-like protein [Roridomyces roridus]